MKENGEKVENQPIKAKTVQDLYFIIAEKDRARKAQEEKERGKKSMLQRLFPFFFRGEQDRKEQSRKEKEDKMKITM
jgi:hypothetical protein